MPREYRVCLVLGNFVTALSQVAISALRLFLLLLLCVDLSSGPVCVFIMLTQGDLPLHRLYLVHYVDVFIREIAAFGCAGTCRSLHFDSIAVDVDFIGLEGHFLLPHRFLPGLFFEFACFELLV